MEAGLFDLFASLGASEEQLDFTVLYASAREVRCCLSHLQHALQRTRGRQDVYQSFSAVCWKACSRGAVSVAEVEMSNTVYRAGRRLSCRRARRGRRAAAWRRCWTPSRAWCRRPPAHWTRTPRCIEFLTSQLIRSQVGCWSPSAGHHRRVPPLSGSPDVDTKVLQQAVFIRCAGTASTVASQRPCRRACSTTAAGTLPTNHPRSIQHACLCCSYW